MSNRPAQERYPELPNVIRRLSRQNMCFREVLAELAAQNYDIKARSLRFLIKSTGIVLRKETERCARPNLGNYAVPSRKAMRMAQRQAVLYVDEQIAAHRAELDSANPPAPFGKDRDLAF